MNGALHFLSDLRKPEEASTHMGTTRVQLDAALDGGHLPEMETLLDGRQQKKIAGRDDWSIRMGRFWSGRSADVEVIDLCNGPLSVLILPTRGLGIWQAKYQDLSVGWNAPARQPVHPRFVNLHDRNGLGWLDGFNELICRCGLSFNGPPGQDDGAASPLESDVTLHGKIANLPASEVELFVDEERQLIGVTGVVEESVLFGSQLRMRSTITSQIGSASVTIEDEILNAGSETAEVELLYHTNFGPPFLEEGSRLECAADRVVPRDGRAAEGVRSYECFLGPTPRYAEQVYYFNLLSNEQGLTRTLLRNRAGNLGVSLVFSKSQLPCFAAWKCTQEERAGYVAGLEPATNFPNFKGFERHHRRVVQLPSGETYRTQLRLDIHSTAEEVTAASEEIARIQGKTHRRIDTHPTAPYCPID
jgi:hypothetical protein